MKVYLLRHGETEWNTEKRFQGREDIPLNGMGILQAQAAVKMFDGIDLDYILTSPLSRARVTAQFVSESTGVPVTVEPDLTERDFGKLSGVVYEGIDIFKLTDESSEVEPIEKVSARMVGVIKKYPLDSSILIVSHGGAINSVLRLAGSDSSKPGRARLKNACLSCLDYDGKEFSIVFFNRTV